MSHVTILKVSIISAEVAAEVKCWRGSLVTVVSAEKRLFLVLRENKFSFSFQVRISVRTIDHL